MKEQIQNLIEHHKLANQEIGELIRELKNSKYPEEENIQHYIELNENEYQVRLSFINDLENLL